MGAQQDVNSQPNLDSQQSDDLKLIASNWDVLLAGAERGFEDHGRGMIFVDAGRIENGGHPIQYVKLASLPDDGADCRRMVLAYDPQKEIVLSVLRQDGLIHSYQLGRSSGRPLRLRGNQGV